MRVKVTRISQEWTFEIAAEGQEWPDVPTGSGSRPTVVRPESVKLTWTSWNGGSSGLRAWVSGHRVLKDGSLSTVHTVEVTYYVPAWLTKLAGDVVPDGVPGGTS
jgi:hypothetical protein